LSRLFFSFFKKLIILIIGLIIVKCLKYRLACLFSSHFLAILTAITMISTNHPLTTFFSTFVKYFQPLIYNYKWTKTFKNALSVLFLGWYTHGCIAGNPIIALLHGLRRLQPQHIFSLLSLSHFSLTGSIQLSTFSQRNTS